jgi:hypothetical protein
MQVHPSVPAKTLPEFIAYAKANPGKINMGSGGVGATGHMAGELFQTAERHQAAHVPYRGESLALTDLLGGQVQVVFATAGSSIQYIKADKLRPLAVTTTERIALLPDLPTLKEYLPGYEASSWNGLTAPKNTPPEIIEKLTARSTRRWRTRRSNPRIVDLGGPPIIGSPADFGKIIAEDTAKWAKVIQFSGRQGGVIASRNTLVRPFRRRRPAPARNRDSKAASGSPRRHLVGGRPAPTCRGADTYRLNALCWKAKAGEHHAANIAPHRNRARHQSPFSGGASAQTYPQRP